MCYNLTVPKRYSYKTQGRDDLKLPMETDYCFRIMYVLAAKGERCDTKELSEKCGISQQIALKVMRKLLCAGLVNSKQGTGGGYTLSREPENIRLIDIYSASGDGIMISRCIEEGYDCSRMHCDKDNCCFHRLFCNINSEIAQKLSDITLDDAVKNKF